jgi:hypothetical protein
MGSLNRYEREKAIDDFDLSFVYERFGNESKLSGENWSKIELEFKKFMKLTLSEGAPLAMIDERVDELWHSFILFTPQYLKFCDDVMGFFVHHQPRTSATPVPEIAINNFVTAYTKCFGELDSLWLERIPTDLKEAIVNGKVPQSPTFRWSGWPGRLK